MPPGDAARPPHAHPPRPRAPRWWLLGAALVAASLAVRVPRLTQSLWYDEYCRTRLHLNADTLHDRLFHDVHNPLYNLFMFGWTGVFGDSEVSLRLPSLIAGYGSALLFAGWAAARLGRTLGVVAGLWAVFSPVHVWYSTEAKNNMFSLLMATLCIVAYDRLAAGRGRPAAVAAVGAGVLGFYTDLIVLMTLVPLWLATWVRVSREGLAGGAPRRPGTRRRLALVGVATAALCLPLALYKSGHVGEMWRGYLAALDAKGALHLFGGYLLHGHAVATGERGRIAGAAIGLALAGPLAVLGFLGLRRTWAGRLVNVSVLWPSLIMATACVLIDHFSDAVRHGVYQERNMIGLLYPFGLMLMAGAGALPWTWATRAAWAGLITLNVTASALMVGAHRDERTVMYPGAPWRGVADKLRADAGGAEAAVVSRSPAHPLCYYWSGVSVRSTFGGALSIDAVREALGGPGSRPLYLLDDGRWWPLTEPEREAMRRAVGLEERFRVGWIVVYRAGKAG